jgi:hypothetical protein
MGQKPRPFTRGIKGTRHRFDYEASPIKCEGHPRYASLLWNSVDVWDRRDNAT